MKIELKDITAGELVKGYRNDGGNGKKDSYGIF